MTTTTVGSLTKGDRVLINDKTAVIEQIVIRGSVATIRFHQAGIIVKTYIHKDSPVRRETRILADYIALAKRQIQEDVNDGTIPSTVKSFSELHDFVDANTYAQMCDGEIWNVETDQWIDDPTPSVREAHTFWWEDGTYDERTNKSNFLMDTINEWIHDGGIR